MRNADGFLLALVPVGEHVALPDGFHIGFGLDSAEAVRSTHAALGAAGIAVTALDGSDGDVTFRCHDPDGTEIEVFWQG